jgi:multiple sugar transport system permease protein
MRKKLVNGILMAAFIIFILLYIFPIYWMFSSAVRPFSLLTSPKQPLIPSQVTFEAFAKLINQTSFFLYFTNTVRIALGTLILNIVLASMAAYSLSRLRFKGKKLVTRAILLAYVFPKMVIVVPLFVTMVNLRLINTYFGLILTYIVFSFPFCVWMLIAYFNKIPIDLEEAAIIDGASKLRVFIQIVIPLALPGLGAAAIFTFIHTWKEFLYAFLLLPQEAKKTMTVGIYGLMGSEVFDWGAMLAFNCLMIIPIVGFFVISQKSFISGLTAGSVKG